MHKKKVSLVPLINESSEASDITSTSFVVPRTPGSTQPVQLIRRPPKSSSFTGETSSTQGVCDCLSVSSPASREPSGQLSGVLQHDLGRALTSKEMPGRTSSTTPATVSKLPAAPTAGQYNLIVPLKSVAMSLDGHLGTVTLSAESIHISYDNSRCFMVEGGAEDVPFVEILCSKIIETKRYRWLWYPFAEKIYQMEVYTFRRAARNPSMWLPRRLVLGSPRERILQELNMAINSCLSKMKNRPKTLLVFVNPYGGRKRATRVYEQFVAPVFAKSGIKASVMTTKYGGDARDQILNLSQIELTNIDGIIAVGGDGLFHEIVNALLTMRTGTGEIARAAGQVRVGHVPAGSTDAVACTLNGTRSAFSSSMRIALGDWLPLDVLRIDSHEGKTKFAVSMASYGFMGDLMAASEKMRWMGPMRYDVVGARMLAANRSYKARIEFLPAPEGHPSTLPKVCTKGCIVCSQQSHSRLNAAQKSFSFHAKEALNRLPEEWQVVEGEFAGIMLVIMPCRSEKSAKGVARYGHLSTGNIHLVMVKRCSRWQYLRFLMKLSSSGLEAGTFDDYVEVVQTVALRITHIGDKKSVWNIDGELLHTNGIVAETHKGAIDVFARGVEDNEG